MRLASSSSILLAVCIFALSDAAKIPFKHGERSLTRRVLFSHDNLQSSRSILPTSDFVGLPPGFIPGQTFIPPTFDSFVDEVVTQEPFKLNDLNIEDVVRINEPGCITQTNIRVVEQTKVYPSSIVVLSTTRLTTHLPDIKTVYTSKFFTQTVTDARIKTRAYTVYSTINRITTRTSFASATILTQTSTSTVNSIVTQSRYTTLTDTIISSSIGYETVTSVRKTTATQLVPHTVTSLFTEPGQTITFTQTQTQTRSVDKYLPGPISYYTRTVHSTQIISATQHLAPKTIARTTTVLVPSYLTKLSTTYGTRTNTVWVTLPFEITKTASVVSTSTRYGIAYRTIFTTATVVESQAQYFTTTVPRVETYSVTQDVPVTTTRYTSYLQPSYYVQTLPGFTITSYKTATSIVSIDKTVTNTLRTPVAYITKTLAENCSRTLQ